MTEDDTKSDGDETFDETFDESDSNQLDAKLLFTVLLLIPRKDYRNIKNKISLNPLRSGAIALCGPAQLSTYVKL